MIGNTAVTQVVKRINDAKIAYGDTSIRAYKYDKGSDVSGEYIAVNNLPFLHEGIINEGTVNINIHVPEQPTGEPNTKRLAVLEESIIGLFPDDIYIGGAFYNFYCDSRPVLDNDKTYYVNLKISVRFSNLGTEIETI